MREEHMKIVIVGHVDHGKSTLIGRLLYDTNSLPEGKIDEIKKTCKALGKELEFAYILDALEEEREQNITIDTTQTFFKTKKRNYVIIDAPGHKEFLKNMITGASLAEAAILIVKAEEGLREQTKRHAYILSMLGLNQIIVVINIFDLSKYTKKKFNSLKDEILKFLSLLNLKPSYIIPISAKEGDNIAKKSKKISWYKSLTLLEALDTFKTKENDINKALRFPVQDVYKINDRRIIVGRIEAGKIAKGDKIILLPSNKMSYVNSIEVFNKKKEKVEVGESIGITIKDPLFIDRGQVICHTNNLPKIASEFKAKVFWMAKENLNINERLTLRCATQEVGCSIKKIIKRINSSTLEVIQKNSKRLEETEVGDVVIKVNEPIVIENFNNVTELGGFVLVKGYDVVAGGIITNTP